MANTRRVLIALFTTIFFTMLGVTIYASLDRSVLQAGPQLKADPWFQATLVDAYLGFITFYAWVAYKKSAVTSRVIWFFLIMLLGNMAMSLFVLLQLRRWDPASGPAGLLLRNKAST